MKSNLKKNNVLYLWQKNFQSTNSSKTVRYFTHPIYEFWNTFQRNATVWKQAILNFLLASNGLNSLSTVDRRKQKNMRKGRYSKKFNNPKVQGILGNESVFLNIIRKALPVHLLVDWKGDRENPYAGNGAMGRRAFLRQGQRGFRGGARQSYSRTRLLHL